MASTLFPERRTRSQISLSDDILRVPERSPMKDARETIRRQQGTSETMDSVDDSEDELLLSPHKQSEHRQSKRSVSPSPRDEYTSRPSVESEGREFKRMKWDLDGGATKNPVKARLIKAGHSRTNSEPNAIPSREISHNRSGTVSLSNKPNSTSNASLTSSNNFPTGVPGKTRAQSVPLFPSSSSLPQLDLRNPPLSPIRARSPPRSPDKYHGLKIHPNVSKEPTAPEEAKDRKEALMEIDEESSAPPATDTDTTMGLVRGDDNSPIPVPEVIVNMPASPSVAGPSVVLSADPPATPAPDYDPFSIPLSPLTPLPDTPVSIKIPATEGEDRYNTGDGWGFSSGKDCGPPVQAITKPDFGQPKNTHSTVSRSQIPRPSAAPPQPTTATITASATKQPSLKMATHKGLTAASSTDALQLLMRNAAKQDKGKEKASSFGSKIMSTLTTARGKGKGKLEPEVRKVSLKDRMRPSEKPKPAPPPRFVPLIFDEEEDQQPEEPEVDKELLEPGAEKPQPTSQSGEPILPVQVGPPSAEPPLVHQDNKSLENHRLSEGKMQPDSTSTPDKAVLEEDPGPPVTNIKEKHIQREQQTQKSVMDTESAFASDLRKLEVEMSTNASVEPQAAEGSQPTTEVEDTSVDRPVPPAKEKSATKKRGQSSIPTSTRVTRSTFKKLAPSVEKSPTTNRATRNAVPQKPFRDVASSKQTSLAGTAHIPENDDVLTEPEDGPLPPASPMETSPSRKTPPREFRTPGSSPAKISLAKTPTRPNLSAPSPSPTKIARAVSMFNRPSDMFAVDDIMVKPTGSSLSTLSNALEKLKMPAPSRPNTSLGFNHTTSEDDDEGGVMALNRQAQSPSNGAEDRGEPGLGRRGTSLKRSFTIAHQNLNKAAQSESQAEPASSKPRLVQKPMTSFFKPGSSSSSKISSAQSNKANDPFPGLGHPTLNGVGARGKGAFSTGVGGSTRFTMANRRLVQKVSKKSSLPVVEASPVKGGGIRDDTGGKDDSIVMGDVLADEGERGGERGSLGNLGDIFMVPIAKDPGAVQPAADGSMGRDEGKGNEKEREKSWKKDSSRRASLALSQLSQSLSAAPAYSSGEKGTMGPPATPRKIARSASSSYPSPSKPDAADPSRSNRSPDKVTTSAGTRSSARQAAKVAKASAEADTKSPSTGERLSSGGKSAGKDKDGAVLVKQAPESLKILKDCVIFVDVRTDDGEEAGSLFVEMLEGLGAKILSRVGQTCTHIIFKNGLMSTVTRYRLLREPKPTAVGIAWVVDCVEQRRHVEESEYVIDLNEVNVAGTNKRRRSMLPKLISKDLAEPVANDAGVDEVDGDADVSMDGSTSSLTLDDDLTPLERARRRRSMIFGPSV